MRKTAFYFTRSATTGFTVSTFPYRSRVSLKEAFARLEPNWKNNFRVARIRPELSAAHAYWRSKSPELPTQAGLCLDGIPAAQRYCDLPRPALEK